VTVKRLWLGVPDTRLLQHFDKAAVDALRRQAVLQRQLY
jgi:hypothetical protein